MTLFLTMMSVCLLLLWLAFALHKNSLVVVCLLSLTTVLIVLTPPVVLLSGMYLRRPVLDLELEVFVPWVAQYVAEMLTTQE